MRGHCGFGDMDIGFGRHGFGKHHGHGHHGFGEHHGFGKPHGHHGHGHGDGPFGHGHGPFGGHHGHFNHKHGHGFMGHFHESMGCGPMRHHGHGGPGGPGFYGGRPGCGSGPWDGPMRKPCHDRRPGFDSDQRTSDEDTGPRGGRGHKGHRGPRICGPQCCQRKFGKGPRHEPQEDTILVQRISVENAPRCSSV